MTWNAWALYGNCTRTQDKGLAGHTGQNRGPLDAIFYFRISVLQLSAGISNDPVCLNRTKTEAKWRRKKFASLVMEEPKSFWELIQPLEVQFSRAVINVLVGQQVFYLVHCTVVSQGGQASNWVVCKNTVPNYPPYTGPPHNTAIKTVHQRHSISNASPHSLIIFTIL